MKPTLPVNPGLPGATGSTFNPIGIVGNATCDTTANGQNTTTPDSCDQVPVNIPAVDPGTPLGALSGFVWVDPNKDGTQIAADPRVAGVKVTLMKGGVIYGETTTDSNGYYIFNNLPAGTDYQVSWNVVGSKPTAAVITALGLPASGNYTYAITTQNVNCIQWRSCATPATALSPLVTVTANQTRQWVNAGLIVANASIDVVKTSTALGEGVVLTPDADGNSAPVTVNVTWTNNGDQPLRDLAWTDTTVEGPAVTGWVCTHDGNPVTTSTILPIGGIVNCVGTLPSMSLNTRHENTFTVTGVGTITGTVVTDNDGWDAAVNGEREWTLGKTSDPVTDSVVQVGSDITYTLTATNNGTVSLRGLRAIDSLVNVTNNSTLVTPLAAGLVRNGSILTWNIPELAVGQTVSVSYTVTVNDDAHGVTLNNTVYGTGVVPPTQCTLDAPCETTHETPDNPWVPPVIDLPTLGGAGVWIYVVLGLLTIGAAGALMGIRRRKGDVTTS